MSLFRFNMGSSRRFGTPRSGTPRSGTPRLRTPRLRTPRTGTSRTGSMFNFGQNNKIVHHRNNKVNINNTTYHIWNRPLWIFIHTVCNKIPDDKEHVSLLYNYLKKLCIGIIPCHYCRKDATNYITKHNIAHDDKTSLILYFFNFHNHVNNKLKKRRFDKSILKVYDSVDTKILSRKVFPLLNLKSASSRNKIDAHNRQVKQFEAYYYSNIEFLLIRREEENEVVGEINN